MWTILPCLVNSDLFGEFRPSDGKVLGGLGGRHPCYATVQILQLGGISTAVSNHPINNRQGMFGVKKANFVRIWSPISFLRPSNNKEPSSVLALIWSKTNVQQSPLCMTLQIWLVRKPQQVKSSSTWTGQDHCMRMLCIDVIQWAWSSKLKTCDLCRVLSMPIGRIG